MSEKGEKRPDVLGMERELERKHRAGEIDTLQYAELLYDAIGVRIDVEYPRLAGLPREDHNPVRLYKKMVLALGLSWPPR